MHYLPLSDNAARQVIDSLTVFAEFERVKAQLRPYAGSMYWKREGGYEYLVKTKPRRRTRERLGARSEKTEQIFADFTQRKQSFEQRLNSLREALTEAERMNKAGEGRARSHARGDFAPTRWKTQDCRLTPPWSARMLCTPMRQRPAYASCPLHWRRKTLICCGMLAGACSS